MNTPASHAKLAANQNNARLSTGPRTEEGKQRSSRNAMRHGLTSKAVVLPWENREEYEALYASFAKDYRPASEREEELLRAMADAWWRLQRARRLETEFFIQREKEIAEAGGPSGDQALVLLFTDEGESRKMRLMMRYLDSAERAWRKAQSDWEKARREAAQRQLEEAALEVMLRPEQPDVPAKAAAVGFVSQTPAPALLHREVPQRAESGAALTALPA